MPCEKSCMRRMLTAYGACRSIAACAARILSLFERIQISQIVNQFSTGIIVVQLLLSDFFLIRMHAAHAAHSHAQERSTIVHYCSLSRQVKEGMDHERILGFVRRASKRKRIWRLCMCLSVCVCVRLCAFVCGPHTVWVGSENQVESESELHPSSKNSDSGTRDERQ
jgi:hypothetical protein